MLNRAFDLLGTAFTMHINLVYGGDLAVIFLSAGIGGGILLGFRFSSSFLLVNKQQNNIKHKKGKENLKYLKEDWKEKRKNREEQLEKSYSLTSPMG